MRRNQPGLGALSLSLYLYKYNIYTFINIFTHMYGMDICISEFAVKTILAKECTLLR